MFTEVLKIITTMDGAALNKMTNRLQTRFMKIAKKFTSAISMVFKGAGFLGAATVLIDKLLNPLKEINESISRTLAQAGDLTDFADEFGSTSGNLLKLQQLAGAKGVESEALYQMLNKFQNTIAEATADPTKQTSVRQFVGQEDMVAAFYTFIQNLKKMSKTDRLLVQQEVFGEKLGLRGSAFLNADFGELEKQIGAKSGAYYTPKIARIDALGDLEDVLAARRNLNDWNAKNNVLNEDMIRQRDRQARLELEQENIRIGNYQSLAKISEASTQILTLVDQGVSMLGGLIDMVKKLSDTVIEGVKTIKNSKLVRGFFGKGE